MAATVKDITDALKGSVSRELLSREGRRVGPKPEDNAGTGAVQHDDLSPVEKKQVESGGHIEGLED